MDLKKLVTPSRVLMAVLVVATLAALAFSGRPWRGYSAPRVAEIATLPDNERLAQVRRYTEYGSGVFYHIGGDRPEYANARQPLKLGFAYHEYGILGMPYWVKGEYGLVTYLDTVEGVQVAGIMPGQVPLLDEMIGEPLASSYTFRWWTRIWGWFFPVLLIALILAWRREARIKEEEHWAS